MSENKVFTIKKTTPGAVLFKVSPLSNPGLSREIYLTNRLPQQVLPLDWVLGIFIDNAAFSMYKKGLFTFTDNEGAIQAAQDAGVYFGEIDFTPAKEDPTGPILRTLKSGIRGDILKAMQTYGDDVVKSVVIANVNQLTNGVLTMLENHWKMQLTLDGGN